LVEARLSAAFGRSVTIDRLEVHPGRITQVSVYEVAAANPAEFDGARSATINRFSMSFDAETWLRSRRIVIPLIELGQPSVNYMQNTSGRSNWDVAGSSSLSPSPEIGNLQIQGGIAHIRMEKERADATVNTSTRGDSVVRAGNGTYSHQPIVLEATSGALLALRDAAAPYPVALQLNNGLTRITLKGHIQDPIAFKGADLKLVLAGPDMELLLPLTGIATPKTPPYKIGGRPDFEGGRIKFTGMTGQVGSSDLNGDFEVNPAGERPTRTANLVSHRAGMEDLGGLCWINAGANHDPRTIAAPSGGSKARGGKSEAFADHPHQHSQSARG
jgi:hypothetical protein